MLAVFGVLGFLMRRFDYPIAPVVVGLILGPVAESQLRRALSDQPRRSDGAPAEPDLGDAARDHRGGLVAPFVMRGLGRFKADED